MNKFLFICRSVISGNSIIRSFLNEKLRHETLRGLVMDIGGGKNNAYLDFVPRAEGVFFSGLDVRKGDVVNFEEDTLPATDNSFDTVLFLNVMEHIFNYQHIANEVVRITKTGGQLVGFVPFLMWYHPDHHDFFRYTHEALDKIFSQSDIKNKKIEAVGMGPFMAGGHMILLLFPRLLRIFVFVPLYLLDLIFIKFRRNNNPKYVLGYYFKIEK